MRSLFATLALALFVAITPPSAQAEVAVGSAQGVVLPAPGANVAPVTATAVANTTAVAPGQKFLIGVELSMQPGWHIYGQDPGEVGKATQISLALPPGFVAGTPRWPQAVAEQQDGFAINAYHGKLFVVIPVTAPASFAETSVSIKVNADWLGCNTNCTPGKANLDLTLPVVANESLASAINPDKFATNVLDGVLHPRDASGEKSGSTSLLWCLVLAFGGGILLNCMPCVLPVLSLKIMSFVKQAHDDRRAIFRMGLAYTAGTMASFMTLAVAVIALKAAGQSVGWGFQFQHPVFLVAMSVLTAVMALSLFGLFEVSLNGGAQGLDKLARKDGPWGAFFMGVLATLLSTPCTAPMLGTALGFALSQSALVILAIFACISLGLSAPYLLLSAFPQFLKWLPKPGMWMVWFKQIMGLIMLASAGWLLWVVQQGFGNAIAGGAVALCAAVGFGAWLVCRYQYGENRARILSWLAAVTVSVTVFLVFLQPVLFNAPVAKAAATGNQLNSEAFTPELLNKYLSEGRVVLVDFTADWCLTCKVNESVVLSSTEVQQKLKELNVAVLRADWTAGDEAITKLLAKFGRSGVPLYVVFSPDKPDQPILLPEIITRQIVIDALKKASGKP